MQSFFEKFVHLFKVGIEKSNSPPILCMSIYGCNNLVAFACLGCSYAFFIDNLPEKIKNKEAN